MASLGKKLFVVADVARKKLFSGGQPSGSVVQGAGCGVGQVPALICFMMLRNFAALPILPMAAVPLPLQAGSAVRLPLASTTVSFGRATSCASPSGR